MRLRSAGIVAEKHSVWRDLEDASMICESCLSKPSSSNRSPSSSTSVFGPSAISRPHLINHRDAPAWHIARQRPAASSYIVRPWKCRRRRSRTASPNPRTGNAFEPGRGSAALIPSSATVPPKPAACYLNRSRGAPRLGTRKAKSSPCPSAPLPRRRRRAAPRGKASSWIGVMRASLQAGFLGSRRGANSGRASRRAGPWARSSSVAKAAVPRLPLGLRGWVSTSRRRSRPARRRPHRWPRASEERRLDARQGSRAPAVAL